MRRGFERLLGVAATQAHRRQHPGLPAFAVNHVEHGLELLVFDFGPPRGLARCGVRSRHHREHRLADELHQAVGENRIVGDDRAAIVLARDVGRGQHRDDARRRLDGAGIEPRDARVGALAQAQRDMARAGKFGDVVDVGRLAGNVQSRRLVRDLDSGSGFARLLANPVFHHAVSAKTLTAAVSSGAAGRVSR